jgi:hypothetical protein
VFGKISAINGIFFLMAAMAAAQVPGPQPNSARHEPQPRPELSTIVQRMEQAARENRERYRAYVITRNYRLYGGNEQKPSSEVIADISFVPPITKEFTITEKKGNSRGEAVVRRILESERKDAASGVAPGAVSRENYDFALLGEQPADNHDCYLLGLKPKRKDKNLLLGRAWVDKNTYLVRRVQGSLVKMPSWWVKSAEVTLEFGDFSGMWLQKRTKALADVRIFGQHTLTGTALKVQTGSTLAEKTGPHQGTKRAFRPQTVLGTIEH